MTTPVCIRFAAAALAGSFLVAGASEGGRLIKQAFLDPPTQSNGAETHATKAATMGDDQPFASNKSLYSAWLESLKIRGLGTNGASGKGTPAQAAKRHGPISVENEKDCPPGYPVIARNIASHNGGVGFSMPADMDVCLVGNLSSDNAGPGYEFRPPGH
jgi:hypothetical protein